MLVTWRGEVAELYLMIIGKIAHLMSSNSGLPEFFAFIVWELKRESLLSI